MSLPKVGLCGVTGRMGQAIVACLAAKKSPLELGLGLSRHSDVSIADFFTHSDVVIDFTTPEACEAHLMAAVNHLKPIVVGITGLSHHHHALFEKAAHSIPIVYARNTSVGVLILSALVEKAAHLLKSKNPDTDVFEIHHHHKKDAPSGTANHLAEAVLKGRGEAFKKIPWYDPFVTEGERPHNKIGIAALRSGKRPGEHTVHFSWGAEVLSLGHTATDRTVFAEGAIQAAAWVVGQKPGLYTMADVLGLKEL